MKRPFRLSVGILAAGLACANLVFAGPRHSADMSLLPPVPYNAADAAKHLEDIRHAWLQSDLSMTFDFIHRPRHAEETRYSGIGWTSTNSQGPVTRFQLAKAPANKTDKPEVWEWVLQNGPSPHVWVLAPGATTAREVPAEKWRDPLLPGMIYTPFDLMMPFLFWSDYKYEGTARPLHRGVDVYTMNPPPGEKAAGLGPVKLFLDREYNALVKMQQLDAKGAVTIEFTLGGIAKVDDQWLFEDCQLENVLNHDYDKFVVKSVALKLKLDPALFDPANLGKPVPLPPASAWHTM